ncbi:class I SAM-dependent methyltransferase [Blastococcus sp. SYSU DS0533]
MAQEERGGAARDRVVRALAGPLRRLLAPLVRDAVAAEADRVIRAVHEVEFRQRRDLLAAGERDAAVRSARFAAREMPTARAFHDRTSTLEHGLEIAPRGGMALEFGVFEGRSLEIVAARRGRCEVYGFDSFEGLPEDYRPHVRAGAFAVGSLPDVEGAELVVGWFEETLPQFLASHPGPVDFVHVDGDLYSSAVTVLELVGPRLAAGSVLVFDEFFNFPGWEAHEFRAWQEWLTRTGARAEYMAYTSNDEQVVVRLTEPGRPAG